MVTLNGYRIYQGILWICVMIVSILEKDGFASYIGFLIGFIEYSLIITDAIIFP